MKTLDTFVFWMLIMMVTSTLYRSLSHSGENSFSSLTLTWISLLWDGKESQSHPELWSQNDICSTSLCYISLLLRCWDDSLVGQLTTNNTPWRHQKLGLEEELGLIRRSIEGLARSEGGTVGRESNMRCIFVIACRNHPTQVQSFPTIWLRRT